MFLYQYFGIYLLDQTGFCINPVSSFTHHYANCPHVPLNIPLLLESTGIKANGEMCITFGNLTQEIEVLFTCNTQFIQ